MSWASANCRFFEALFKVSRPMASAVRIKFLTMGSPDLSTTVKTRIKEHVFWRFRLILFLYIGCFLQNQPENVLKVGTNEGTSPCNKYTHSTHEGTSLGD